MAKNDTTTDTSETTPEQRLAERIATFLVERGFFEELAQEGIHVTDDDAPAREDDDTDEGERGGTDAGARSRRPTVGATNGGGDAKKGR